jgi:hypothetical protein
MKKPKISLDTAKIKGFFVEHGEKFLVAIAVAILVSFAISALNRETLPDDLRAPRIAARSDDARAKIESSKPPAKIVPSLDFVGGVTAWSAGGIQTGSYKLANPLSTPTFPDPVKRTDPTLFPVTEMQVVPFRGPVTLLAALAPAAVAPTGPAIAPAGPPVGPAKAPPREQRPRPAGPGVTGGLPAIGGLPMGPGALGNVQGGPQPLPASMRLPGPQSTGFAEYREGVMVTALIPFEAQNEEYERVFQHARKVTTGTAGTQEQRGQNQRDLDTPHYVWCRLERTDTTDGSVKLLDFGDVEQVRTDWKSPERRKAITVRISPEYRKLEADMRDWGAQVEEVVDPDYVAQPWLTWPLPPLLLHDWGLDAAHPKIPLASAQASAVGPAAGPKQPGDDAGFGDDKGAPVGPGQGPAMRQRTMMMPPGAGRPGLMEGEQADAHAVPYKLFRFVDFDVTSGHAYQYRVQLLLRNPNFGLEPQLLAKPDPNAAIYRETPWSEKSPSATFPPETQLASAGINRQHKTEPKAKLGILLWDKHDAIQLLKEVELDVGDVANFGKQTVKEVADAVTRTVHDVSADFTTGAVLVDLRGNEEKLPGSDNLTDPAELLLLTNVGDPEHSQLIVLNEAVDRPLIDAWDKTHKVPAAAAAEVPIGAVRPTVTPPVNPRVPGPAGNSLPPRQTPPRVNNNPTKTR